MNFDDIKLPYLFNDRFLLKGLLGVGGYGRVYLAQDEFLNKNVAIKVLNKTVSEQHLVRFQKEAKAVAKLKHPNIIEIFDFGISGENCCYLTMEYVDGSSLEDLLKHRGHLPAVDCLDIFLQLVDGLIHAHGHQLLHRDIKPSNVMLVKDGNKFVVKLVDFGIAKFIAENQELTAQGSPIGSPFYVSPEQVLSVELDQRADIYSVGCLMYETLTGQVPFKGDDILSTMKLRLESTPLPFNQAKDGLNLPASFEELILKCLERERDKRFKTAQELKEALSKIELEATADKPVAVEVVSQSRNKSNFPVLIFGLIVLTCVLPVLTSPMWIEKLYPRESDLPPVFHQLNDDIEDRFPEISTQGKEQILPVEANWKIRVPVLDKDAWTFVGEQNSVVDLNLERCKVDDFAFERVCHLTNLKSLKIWSTTPVSLEAFEKILQLKNLESLRVQDVGIDSERMEILGKLTGLDSLDIAFNDDIKSGDLKYLKSLKNLGNFTIGNPKLPMKEVVDFVNSMPKIKHLGIRTLPEEKKQLEALKNLKKITSLDMSKCGSVDVETLGYIAKIPSVLALDLSRTNVNSENLVKLNASPKLSTVYLKANGYVDRDLFFILKLKGFETINITKNFEITDDKLKTFIAQAHLRKVAKNIIADIR